MNNTGSETASNKTVATQIGSGVHHLGMGVVWAGFLGMSVASTIMLLTVGIPALGIALPVAASFVNNVIILSSTIAVGTYSVGALFAAITAKNKDAMPEAGIPYVTVAGGVAATMLGLYVAAKRAPDIDNTLHIAQAFSQAVQAPLISSSSPANQITESPETTPLAPPAP